MDWVRSRHVTLGAELKIIRELTRGPDPHLSKLLCAAWIVRVGLVPTASCKLGLFPSIPVTPQTPATSPGHVRRGLRRTRPRRGPRPSQGMPSASRHGGVLNRVESGFGASYKSEVLLRWLLQSRFLNLFI